MARILESLYAMGTLNKSEQMVQDMYFDLCSTGFSDSWLLGCVWAQIRRSISSQELSSGATLLHFTENKLTVGTSSD
jgi:hypothetical protein